MKAYLKGHIMFPLIAISVLLLVGLMFDSSDDDNEDDLINLRDEGFSDDLSTKIDVGALLLNEGDTGDQYIATDDAIMQQDREHFSGSDADDLIIGGDQDQRFYGNDGNDGILGKGGDDRLHGHYGDDTLFGGDGDDQLTGYVGDDVLYGGAGDDIIYPDTWSSLNSDEDSFDVVAAGAGDDLIHLTRGVALIELGEGQDDVIVQSALDAEHDDPVAIITDFNPDDDQIVLGVRAPDYDFPDDMTEMDVTYTLSEIETSQGLATLVTPAVDDETLANDLNPDSVGYAVLIGVTPDDIQDGNIRVILTNGSIYEGAADR